MTSINSIYELEDLLPSDHINDIVEYGGDNYPDCERCYEAIEFTIPKARAIALLEEYGAWSFNELHRSTMKELKIKLIWIAAWNVAER